MSFLSDFKEFRKLKKQITFNTDNLYIAPVGRILIRSNYDDTEAISDFVLDRIAIVSRATPKEIKKHLRSKYGSFYDFETLDYEKIKYTIYYKEITHEQRILPASTPCIINDLNTPSGVYEVIRDDKLKKLDLLIGSESIRLANNLTLEDIKSIEDAINNHIIRYK